MLLLLLLYFLLFAFLSWRKPVWAIALICAALPSYLIRFQIGPIPFTLLEGMILILFAVWLIKECKACPYGTSPEGRQNLGFKKFLHTTYYILPTTFFLLAATISIFVSSNTIAALGIWKAYFIEPVLFFIVLLSTLSTNNESTSNLRIKRSEGGCDEEHLRAPLVKIFNKIKEWRGEAGESRGVQPSNNNKPILRDGSSRSFPSVNLILFALGFSALYISAIAIFQKFTGWEIPNLFWQTEETRRVTSVFGYPNAIGLYLAPIIVLAVGQLIKYVMPIYKSYANLQIANKQSEGCSSEERLRAPLLKLFYRIKELLRGEQTSPAENQEPVIAKLSCRTVLSRAARAMFWFLVIISSVAAIVFSRTEAAWIAVTLGLIAFGLLVKKFRLITVIIGIVLITVIIGVSPIKNYLWEKVTLQDASGKIRTEMWKETIEMLKQKPILGAGLAGYQAAIAPYHQAKHIEIYLYPHNIFLNFLSETGLLGLLAFLWLIFVFFWRGLRQSTFNYSLLAAMLTILVHGLVDVPYLKNDLAIIFWLLLGLQFSSYYYLRDPQARPH